MPDNELTLIIDDAPAQSAEDIEEAPSEVLPPLYKKKYDPYGLYPYYNTYHYSRDYGKKR